MDPNPKQQAVERIKDATNILVTVSKNPTVDQLSACIGFTLLLNKLGKHATAVFSGMVPSTLEFLQPEKTLEQNTDSLRDFIIALDKSKADKLRYKVEDEVVRIFITPYRTSISEKDLVFSQGDFNVDVVVALGVTNKDDIDQAIVAHGRILHDAVVLSVTDGDAQSDVGTINWHDAAASSLSEMLVSISESFQSGLLDGQMATAFLTGIVAETERFSNGKTTPKVMTMSAQLMAAGANQQLIATKLTPEPVQQIAPVAAFESQQATPYTPPNEQSEEQKQEEPKVEEPKPDGEIEIQHEEDPKEPVDENEIHIDDQGNLKLQEEMRRAAEEAEKQKHDAEEAAKQAASDDEIKPTDQKADDSSYIAGDSHKIISPLSTEKYDPLAAFAPPAAEEAQQTDASSEPSMQLPPVVAPDTAVVPPLVNDTPFELTPVASIPSPVSVSNGPVSDSLAQLEQDVHSPHVGAAEGAFETPAVDDARQAVSTAGLDSVPRPQASQSVGAQIMDLGATSAPEVAQPNLAQPAFGAVNDTPQQTASAIIEPTTVIDPMSPPPVPPPMMPQYYNPQSTHAYLSPQDQASTNPTPDLTQM